MKITRMTIQNFLSFGEAEFDLDGSGLTLVEGENLDDESARSNGSGKSAMIDALVWCLFGSTLRGYENDEVVNRKVGEDCVVTVRLIPNDESVAYEVSRARRHRKLKNTLRVVEINRGGESSDASGSSNTETQEAIEKLLGCTKRTFLSSVVFGQDRAYRFSSLTDKDQKEILDEVLGVERFSAAYVAARAKLSEVNTSIADIQRHLEQAKKLKEQADDEIENLREKDEAFVRGHEAKIALERVHYTKAKQQLGKLSKVDSTTTAIDLSACRGAVKGIEKIIAKAMQEEAAAKIAAGAIRHKLSELRDREESHKKLSGDCPTCAQKIDRKHQAKVVAAVKKAIEGAVATSDELDAITREKTKDLESAKKRLRDARDAVLTAEKVHNEAVGAEADVKSWKRRLAEHESRIAEYEVAENPYTDLLQRVRTKSAKYGKDVSMLTGRLEEEEVKLKIATFWVDAFSAKGLRSLLIDSSLPLLNEEAARISRAVTGGSIDVEFSATSELKSGKTVDKFEVRVDNKHGAGTYAGNSAGERAKVDLCVGLALQKLVASRSSASFNVVFFDEVFDHLDGAAHERVVEVLSEIDKDSVFVVSHDEGLKAWFPASLRIVKKGGFSRVEV